MSDGKSAFRLAPLALGLLSLALLAVYLIQRTRLLQAQSTNHLALSYLHLIGAISALVALAGLALSLFLRKTFPRSTIVVIGGIANVIASVWGFVLNFL